MCLSGCKQFTGVSNSLLIMALKPKKKKKYIYSRWEVIYLNAFKVAFSGS